MIIYYNCLQRVGLSASFRGINICVTQSGFFCGYLKKAFQKINFLNRIKYQNLNWSECEFSTLYT